MPPSQFCSFLWNLFLSYYLKTNKVKYIKIYIFSKGISQEIYLNRQILVKDCIFEKSPKKWFFCIFVCFCFLFCFVLFLSQFYFYKGKNIFGQKSPKKLRSLLYFIHVYIYRMFLTFVINILFWKILAFFLLKKQTPFQFKMAVKSHFLSLSEFNHSYFADT